MRGAISAGIGLFLALIGLKNAGLVVSNSSTLVALIDFSKWGDPELHGLVASALVALVGLVVIGALHARRIKGSIIIGILVATIVGVPLGVTSFGGFSMNIGQQFSDFVEVSLFKMDFAGLFADSANVFQMVFTLVMIVISFSLVDMFDTIGTLLGTAKQANMLDQNGDMPRMRQAMMADALATTVGACLGSSTATTFVESHRYR